MVAGETVKEGPVTTVSNGPASSLIVAVTAVAVIVFVRELRHIVSRSEWCIGATLAFLIAALASSLVDVILTFTDQWKQYRDPFGNVLTEPPNWAHQMQVVFYVVIAIGCVGVALTRIVRPGASIYVPALLFFLLALLSGASAVLHGDNPVRPYYLVLLAILATTVVAPRGLGVHVGIGTFCFITALAGGLTLVVNPGFAIFECGVDKCGLLNFNFRGFLDNENALALYLTLAMPFIFVAFGRRSGAILCTYTLFLVLLTGSKTGTIAAIVTYLLLLIVQPDIRRPRFSFARATVLYGVLAIAGVVGIVLPIVVDDPTAFTGRAYLWILARHTLSDPATLLFGSGSLGWENVRKAGLIDFSAVYSVHNEWLQVLFSTGLLGVLVLIAALGLLLVQAGRRYSLIVGCVLAPVICLATTERPWSIDTVDWLSWVLPATLLCYPVLPGRADVELLAVGSGGLHRSEFPSSDEESDHMEERVHGADRFRRGPGPSIQDAR